MAELIVEDLWASSNGNEVLKGVSLEVSRGQVHAVMGPNGSGKSTLAHVLMGRPGYEVTSGSITLDGRDIVGLSPFERAQAGLFLVMQYPIEVPGVSLEAMLTASFEAAGRDIAEVPDALIREAAAVELDVALLERSLNDDLSGGERKRSEAIQLGMLHPKVAVLDEVDSGLDVDALRTISRRIEAATLPENDEEGLAVLAITHYTKLFAELEPDKVYVLIKGKIAASGGKELAHQLEAHGYDQWDAPEEVEVGIRLG